MAAQSVDRKLNASDDVTIDIEIRSDRQMLKLLLQFTLSVAGAPWTPLYTFVFEPLTVETTDMLWSEIRDLQEAVQAIEVKPSSKPKVHYWRAAIAPSGGAKVPMTFTEKMTSSSDVFVLEKAQQQLQVRHTAPFQLTLQITYRDSAFHSSTTVTQNGTSILSYYGAGDQHVWTVPYSHTELVQVKEGDTFEVTTNADTAPVGSLMLLEVSYHPLPSAGAPNYGPTSGTVHIWLVI